MENMIMLSRMENVPVTPVAPPPPVNKPIPPVLGPTEDICAPCMPALAMAYVPMQQWRGIYEPDVALSRGTLFSELDKPFIGEEVRFK